MNWVPTQLTLNLSPTFVPKTITEFFYHLSTIPSATQKLSMLEDFSASLAHELAKIEPLKRELPFCMQLLNDAISAVKVESDKYRAHKSEKRQYVDEKKKEDSIISELSLRTLGTEMQYLRTSPSREISSSPQKKTDRKLWKSWTPELHRKFLDALEVLGGSEVATPKQIRAVMKVDGLTNDEVKTYLQKYRLHTRRVPPANLSVVVSQCQGLWIYNNFSKGSSSDSGSGSPQGPFQLTTESGEGISATMEEDEDVKS